MELKRLDSECNGVWARGIHSWSRLKNEEKTNSNWIPIYLGCNFGILLAIFLILTLSPARLDSCCLKTLQSRSSENIGVCLQVILVGICHRIYLHFATLVKAICLTTTNSQQRWRLEMVTVWSCNKQLKWMMLDKDRQRDCKQHTKKVFLFVIRLNDDNAKKWFCTIPITLIRMLDS